MAETSGESWLQSFPWVRDRYLEQGGTDVEECAHELERFFELTRKTNLPLAMISRQVDLLWHTFIQFTESYAAFCQSRFGEMIHHRSRTPHSPVPDAAVRNFVKAYERNFGPLTERWIETAEPALLAFALGKTDSLDPAARWSGWPGRDASPLA